MAAPDKNEVRRADKEISGILLVAIALVVLVATFLGWRTFWFLTDDAYIAFRYVSQSIAGRGYVWNPPPFAPVEGYTSFLWVFLLRQFWALTGWTPPEVANWVALGFGYASLILAGKWMLRMHLPPEHLRQRAVLLVLVLCGVVANRTFLTWLSSGLETSMFNFLVIWWVYLGTGPDTGSRRFVLQISTCAALIALTRPDGLLFVAGTMAIVAERGLREPVGRRWNTLVSAAPLLLVPTHVLWRRLFYGEWLPNTYYAKHVAAWPESGARYLASFVVEYGVWVWLLLLLVAVALRFHRRPRPSLWDLKHHWAKLVTLGVVSGHVGYYTFVIGGDHFEYRVYSHLVILLFVSGAWLATRISWSAGWAQTALAAFVLTSLPIPWTHWALTHEIDQRKQAHVLRVPVAPAFPAQLRPVIAKWDSWQHWLITHYVGMRHQEHKVFHAAQTMRYPSREDGARLLWDERGILAVDTVGIPAWVLPGVAIIDTYGLNDLVIARTPVENRPARRMAHDRYPPIGYVECFRPNVRIEGRRVVRFGDHSLTDDEIRACETRDWVADSQNYNMLRKKGFDLVAAHKYSEAADAYRRAVELFPMNSNSANSYNNLGWSYQQLGRLQEALAAYKSTLRLDPNHRLARNNLEALEQQLTADR